MHVKQLLLLRVTAYDYDLTKIHIARRRCVLNTSTLASAHAPGCGCWWCDAASASGEKCAPLPPPFRAWARTRVGEHHTRGNPHPPTNAYKRHRKSNPLAQQACDQKSSAKLCAWGAESDPTFCAETRPTRCEKLPPVAAISDPSSWVGKRPQIEGRKSTPPCEVVL